MCRNLVVVAEFGCVSGSLFLKSAVSIRWSSGNESCLLAAFVLFRSGCGRSVRLLFRFAVHVMPFARRLRTGGHATPRTLLLRKCSLPRGVSPCLRILRPFQRCGTVTTAV